MAKKAAATKVSEEVTTTAPTTRTPTSSIPDHGYFDGVKISEDAFKFVFGKDKNVMFALKRDLFKDQSLAEQELLDWPREEYERLFVDKKILDYLHNTAGPGIAVQFPKNGFYTEYWNTGKRYTDADTEKVKQEMEYKHKFHELIETK
jgi:hypothetical protein